MGNPDLIQWDAPILVVPPAPGERLWYPTIVGTSDVIAGQVADLAYAYFPDALDLSRRQFVRQSIQFSVAAGCQ